MGRGRPFKKGTPRPEKAGRKPGGLNRQTLAVRSAIEAAACEIGGVDRLVAWIKESAENEYVFWSSMYLKLLPIRVMGSGERGEIELNVRITEDELLRKLRERGLPTFVLGADKPLVDDDPPTGTKH